MVLPYCNPEPHQQSLYINHNTDYHITCRSGWLTSSITISRSPGTPPRSAALSLTAYIQLHTFSNTSRNVDRNDFSPCCKPCSMTCITFICYHLPLSIACRASRSCLHLAKKSYLPLSSHNRFLCTCCNLKMHSHPERRFLYTCAANNLL